MALMHLPEGKRKPGGERKRAGCPEAMHSRNLCLFSVSKGNGDMLGRGWICVAIHRSRGGPLSCDLSSTRTRIFV